MKKIIPDDSVLVPDIAQRVFQGQIFDVFQWPQTLFDGTEATFEMLKRPDTVIVVCVVEDKIIVVDDEQPHTGSRKSFPGGRVDSTDASIEAAAHREVLEETGYGFKNWRLVKVWQPHTKIEWFIHVLVAWEATSQQSPKLDPGEKIQVEKLTFEELKSFVVGKSSDFSAGLAFIQKINKLDGLGALPEFKGQTVDR